MLYNLQVFFCQHQKVFQAVLQEEGWPHLDSLLTRCVVKFYLQYHYCSHLWSANREQQWQRRQGKRQKSNRFRSAKEQLFMCIFSCAFLYIFRHCMTSTLNCVISRFVEDGNTRQQLSFPFLQPFRILIQLQKNMPCNIWRIERDGSSVIKFKAARIHFYSVVFIAVAVVVA